MDGKKQTARLILEDGSTYEGASFGASHSRSGEVVFNTGMVGYPETLTDPSYRGQILVMTFPLVGNYGVPKDGFESDGVQIQGLIVSEYCADHSHWEATKSLGDWLTEHNVPAISGLDTRALTKKIREKGAMLGKIVFANDDVAFEDPNKRNLAAEISISEPVEYKHGRKKIILIDCGVKNNIVRAFERRNITVLRCPWNFDFTKEKCDGVVLSNGPGDPKMCEATIEHVRKALRKNTPMLGICLGSQIIGLATGADTYKLKFGHRGHNQPCVESGTKRCYITPQNHGFAVDTGTLPQDWREWFYNNNDRTNEGIIHISKPFFGAQFHPEASPGPDDTEFIFDMFVRAL